MVVTASTAVHDGDIELRIVKRTERRTGCVLRLWRRAARVWFACTASFHHLCGITGDCVKRSVCCIEGCLQCEWGRLVASVLVGGCIS